MRLLLALTLALSPLSEPAMLGELIHLVRVLEKRATATPATDSLMHALGLRGDAASSTGSLHAKVKDIKDNPPSVVNSIQRGTVAVNTGSSSGTATITSVTTAKTFLSYLGISNTSSTGNVRITLTNSTTVTANRGDVNGDTTASYEVVELK